MNLKDKENALILERAFGYVSGNPRENLPKLLKWADEFDIWW